MPANQSLSNNGTKKEHLQLKFTRKKWKSQRGFLQPCFQMGRASLRHEEGKEESNVSLYHITRKINYVKADKRQFNLGEKMTKV